MGVEAMIHSCVIYYIVPDHLAAMCVPSCLYRSMHPFVYLWHKSAWYHKFWDLTQNT